MWEPYKSYDEKARYIIEHNKYMVLATVDKAGNPWANPVFYAHDGVYNFYFLSATDSRHAENMAKNQKVAIAIFDSAQPLGLAEGVQMEGKVSEVKKSDLKHVIEYYNHKLFPNSDVPASERYDPASYTAPAEFRFYKVTITKAYTTGPDRRVEVDLQSDK